jgi:hypothetical protein
MTSEGVDFKDPPDSSYARCRQTPFFVNSPFQTACAVFPKTPQRCDVAWSGISQLPPESGLWFEAVPEQDPSDFDLHQGRGGQKRGLREEAPLLWFEQQIC